MALPMAVYMAFTSASEKLQVWLVPTPEAVLMVVLPTLSVSVWVKDELARDMDTVTLSPALNAPMEGVLARGMVDSV